MTKIISVFNNKGGVGKTILTWNIGDALARLGKRVLLIDFDPQCNLSLAILGEKTFGEKLPTQNIPYGTTVRAYLQRFLQTTGGSEVFLHQSETDEKSGEYKTHENVKLIAGDFWLNVYGESLNVGNDLLAGTGISKYVVLKDMVTEAAKEGKGGKDFDYVLIDLPPSFGSLVRVALYSSNYYIVPCTSDTFSAYCVSLIGQMFPKFLDDWRTGIKRFKEDNPHYKEFDHLGSPTFAGWIFNGFDTRGESEDGEKKQIKADQVHYGRISDAVKEHLIQNEKLGAAKGIVDDGILGKIEDMNTLIQNSIWLNVPIGQLGEHKPVRSLRDSGRWAPNQIDQIELLRNQFTKIATNIIERCV